MTDELRLSVSKTKCFEQCRKQYHFSYILKLPKKERDYHIFGKFCHKALEDFHNAYIGNKSTNPFNVEMGNGYKNAIKEFGASMTPEMKKECWDILNKYLKNISDKKLPLNVIECEKNFSFPISENVVLNGMIDRIQIDDDGVLHVADYKTTKNKKYLKNDWFQLLSYAYVLIQEDPTITKIRASYILLRHDFEYITTEFSVPEIFKVKDKYLEYAKNMINEKEFPATTSNLCSFCDFLESCVEGRSNSFNNKNVYGEVNW